MQKFGMGPWENSLSGRQKQENRVFGLLVTKAHRAQAGTGAVFILMVVLIMEMLIVDERKGSRMTVPRTTVSVRKRRIFWGWTSKEVST